VKHCASCGRDIPESATVCEPCQKWAAEHVAAPSAPASSPALAKRVSRRDLLIILVALGVGGVLMFGLLSSRGGSATGVAAAPGDLLKSPRPVVPAVKARPVATQAWSSQRRAYWTGSQRNSAAFELAAENSVSIWLNQVRPLLIVRCLSKRTEAFVFTGSALTIEPQTEDHTVSFRFDDEQATTVRWPDSAEHDALFAPDAVEFAQRVMHAQTLRFGYTPHNAAPVEAHFEVSGLTGLIEPVAKECGWKK
jgi:Type VI secretion system VasI, EvfG, VC_A0118